VLDEADRLLSTTFASELSYIFEVLPQERQTCLFTATITPSIESIASAVPKPGKSKPFVHRMSQRSVFFSYICKKF
jgi:ATP-dependent RNA helicase DDX49/DBP8